MNAFRKILFAAAIALCAAPALAGYAVQYFVGYGLYYPDAPDVTSTVARTTGLLATNGNHRALVQLIWAGPNGVADWFIQDNPDGGYVSGDDMVLDSRILEAGVDGIDEWGYAATLPQPFVTTNSLLKPVYVRVHMDDSPEYACHWWYDSPVIYPPDLDAGTPYDAFATGVHVETGSETPPTAGVALNQWVGPIGVPHVWCPDAPSDPEIHHLEFDPATAGSSFPVPFSYSLHAVYGADAPLPGGGWDWKLLAEDADYAVADGVVTLTTAGTGLPKFRIVRLGLIHDF